MGDEKGLNWILYEKSFTILTKIPKVSGLTIEIVEKYSVLQGVDYCKYLRISGIQETEDVV